jgi:hypothetical protein
VTSHAVLAGLVALAFAAPVAARAASDADSVAAKGRSVPKPKERNISYYVDGFEQTVRPLSRPLDPVRIYRRVSGNQPEAYNVDENDQVRLPSTWWTPRVGFQPVTPEQMLRGPGPGTGPAPGKWRVVQAKSKGVSPGFQIKDAAGTRFAIKFDPPAYPELTTSADVISSKLLWAAGYNVPDNVIVRFRREDLTIDPKAKYKDPLEGERPVSAAYLDGLLEKVYRYPDGSYRAIASRFLAGKPLGEFRYEGRRTDDPEDLIPHELRRELRGLWTVNAWINHDDCSARNTLDMYVTENGRSFVRHYLIDFSGTLGAQSITKHSYRSGYEYLVDYGVALKSMGTLGLMRPHWEHAVDPEMPSIGFIDAATFDPSHWRPFLPNPAFDEKTLRDKVWGARIVAGFDDSLIRAAVKAGRLSDPRAEDYLIRVLIERRDKIVHRWLPSATAAQSTGTAP